MAKLDLVDALVWILFLLRVGVLGLMGGAFAWVGFEQTRLSFQALGFGIILCAVAGFFMWHPARASGRWPIVLGLPGLLLVALSFALQ